MANAADERRKALGRRIKRARVRAGYRSQKAFADAIGISENSVARAEIGDERIGDKVFAAIEDGLGWGEYVVAEYLETGDESIFTDSEPAPEPAEPARPSRDELLMRYRQLEGVMEIVVEEQRRWREREEDVRRQIREIDAVLSGEISSPERRNVG
ncbi:helix-turn-helix domain-containing protein [Amycolatopsis taiwanensis]|uniref:helix-turn-helix domain-containing protein n=1 Tax=Amycolatopsis taiwanensis TaxID=342230 RepID=UPI0004845EE1|nr:helix-turn-helix transcriptional regulator [Amycolatopsis taiwanensis]